MDDEHATSSGEEGDVDEGGDEEQNDDKKQGVEGMADVISKILSKTINSSNEGVILSKYKEAKKRKLDRKEETQEKNAKAKAKTEFREMNHVIPDRSRAEKEVMLRRIGTKGVVKLFNAVAKHQKEMDLKLKKANTEGKKDRVLESVSKSSFLDMLKSDSKAKKNNEKSTADTEVENVIEKEKKAASWNVLSDDFMMGSKMKDWDREDEKTIDKNIDEDVDETSEDNSDESS